MVASALAAIPVMVLLTIVQTSILPNFLPGNVTPSLPFVVAMAWTLQNGIDEGIVWAFVGGLIMDIFTIAPLGGLAISYMLAIVVAGLVKDLFPANRIIVPLLFALLASVVQQLLYALFLGVFGVPISMDLASFVQLVITQSLLVLPVYWLVYYVGRTLRPRPVQI